MSQPEIAKKEIIKKIARYVRKCGLTYADWRYVAKHVRQRCELRPAKRGRRLPRVITQDELHRVIGAADKGPDTQHGLILRFLFYTGCRVSEMVRVRPNDVDLDAGTVRIEQGKGGKDRYVLIPDNYITQLRLHLGHHKYYRYLFQSNRDSRFSPRRVQQLVRQYGQQAGVDCTPHTFRHACLTHLTRASTMADAEIQLISGHARRDSLELYQHIAYDVDLRAKYKDAMRNAII